MRGKKRKILPEDEIFRLREQRFSYYDIERHFTERGIIVNHQTIRLRCKEIYAKLGKEEPKAISNATRKSHELDEEIYELKKNGLTYSEILKVLESKGYNITKTSISKKSKEIFKAKGEEEPKVDPSKYFKKRDITDEEIYNLRKKKMSYVTISKYLEKQGKFISLFGVRKRCKKIFKARGEEEPYAKSENKGRRKKEVDREELSNFRARGLSYREISKIYEERGIDISTETLGRIYREMINEKGEEQKYKLIKFEELEELRKQGLSFDRIAKYYHEKGIKISENKLRDIYVRTKGTGHIGRSELIPEALVYDLKQQGLTYKQIVKYLSEQGIKTNATSIGVIFRRISAEREGINAHNTGETLQELETQLKRTIDQKKASSELLKQYEGLRPKAQEQER